MDHTVSNTVNSRWIICLSACAALLCHDAAGDSLNNQIGPVLEEFCFKCHGPEKPKGGIQLSDFRDESSVQGNPALWLKVREQLHERLMPPEGKPQPTFEQRDLAVKWIEQALDKLDQAQKDPGPKVLHRLNRLEYNNTVRDLLGITSRPADNFPADAGGGGGFDNNAETLFVPPVLLEQWILAAESVLEEASRENLFVAHPGFFTSERSAARKNLERFAQRAFRRPVHAEDTESLLALYDARRKAGDAPEQALKHVYKVILVSPSFLFRVEEDRSEGPHPVSDFELASRLSYFLWSSMPDEELFRLASQRRLRQPAVLEAQVRRMLADPKARALAENFTTQWLGVRRLETSVHPDAKLFPTYTPTLRQAMLAEPVEFFYALLREDRSLMNLIDADFTFVNEELARHYGITNVVSDRMQRVQLADANRGGVLGMAGVLTLTSFPQRTSPVLRGKWVLEEILGSPPPPPPPLVPSLPNDDRPRDGLTLRQRLEAHRAKAECGACHQRLDPIGFGLENFDAIGRWRSQIGGQPVDALGVLNTGEQFDGPAELKKILLNRREAFARNLTERMLAYALGRGVEFCDRPTVKKITSALAENDYRISTLILEIANSYPFQYRRGTDDEIKP